MSRSYKMTPLFKEHIRGMKNTANRKVRRCNTIIANGYGYRKVFCSYDISDYAFYETYAEHKARIERLRSGRNCIDDVSYWDWYKIFKRK